MKSGFIMVRKRSAGFTLIEVLVSLVVLMVGLLGLAGLQLLNLKANHSAYLRTQASIAAYDILDRMRANKAEALATTEEYNRSIPDPATEANCVATATGTVADDDLAEWTSYLWDTLPFGCGSVDVDHTTAEVTIVVQWNDTRGDVLDYGESLDKDTQTFSMTSQL